MSKDSLGHADAAPQGAEITTAMVRAGAGEVDRICWRVDPSATPISKYVAEEIAAAVFRAMISAQGDLEADANHAA